MMLKRILLLSAVALALLLPTRTAGAASYQGKEFPDFTATDALTGRKFSLSNLRGKVVLIDFWATWCGPCIAAMPHMKKLYDDLGPKGLTFVSVNTEPDNLIGVREFVAKNELRFPVYVDSGAMRRRFMVDTFPTVMMVDRNNVIRHIHIGSTSIKTLRREAEALLAAP